jgi:hypothetical protein
VRKRETKDEVEWEDKGNKKKEKTTDGGWRRRQCRTKQAEGWTR